MKKYIWKLCTRAWPEGQILPFWALVVRAILYPLDTFYWQMSKSRGYDWLTNTWKIDGVKWSGVALRHMAIAQGVIFKITTTNGIATLQAVQPEPVVQTTVLRSDFDFIMQEKQRCVKLVEETYNLLAEGKPLEAKELLQKRVNN